MSFMLEPCWGSSKTPTHQSSGKEHHRNSVCQDIVIQIRCSCRSGYEAFVTGMIINTLHKNEHKEHPLKSGHFFATKERIVFQPFSSNENFRECFFCETCFGMELWVCRGCGNDHRDARISVDAWEICRITIWDLANRTSEINCIYELVHRISKLSTGLSMKEVENISKYLLQDRICFRSLGKKINNIEVIVVG